MSRRALQLHTVRSREVPYADLLEEVARAGFEGIEFADRFHEEDPEEVRRVLRSESLEPVAAHVDLQTLRQNREPLIDRFATVGCDRVIIPHLPIERFRTPSQRTELQNELHELGAALARSKMELLVHTTRELLLPFLHGRTSNLAMRPSGLPRGAYNHMAWALATGRRRTQRSIRQRTPLGRLVTENELLSFEVDVKSVATAGYDLTTVLDVLADRAPLVHLSDVRRSRRLPPAYEAVSPGHGRIDPQHVIEAVEERPIEWLIGEHDHPEDPSQALEELATLLCQSNPALTDTPAEAGGDTI